MIAFNVGRAGRSLDGKNKWIKGKEGFAISQALCYRANLYIFSHYVFQRNRVVLLHDRESIVDVQFAVASNDSELDRAEARSARSTPCLCGYRAGRRLRNEDVDACEGRKKERKKKKIENAEKRLFSSKNDSRKEFSCIFDRNLCATVHHTTVRLRIIYTSILRRVSTVPIHHCCELLTPVLSETKV